VRVTSVSSTYCFVHSGDKLAQVVRVVVAGAPEATTATVSLEGPQLAVPASWQGLLDPELAGQEGGPAWAPRTDPGLADAGRYTPQPSLPEGVVVEVPMLVSPGQSPGSVVRVRAVAEAGSERATAEADVVVREPGWRMLMVAHFHYDPVWWNTQAGYTSGWDELLWAQDKRDSFQHTGLVLVEAHLQRARVDPRYKFVLAEVDYLKPFWDLYPDRRAELKALLEAGRLEIVGGTYNEPNTNLTGAETGIRAAVYGMGFQRDVMGADPRSAWQLDVFGHDPQFPGIMAECGLDSSAWARGPFHQWGPHRHTGSNSWMQFPSEFEWVAPNGRGLLTSYMPNHYSSGWELERATSLEGSMWRAYELFSDLADVAATQVTLLPVGTDYTPPSRFISDVAETWGARYAWPRFEVGLPREFFAAVREELSRRGVAASPQSRDMNPIYTGKDVSFIDTKQAQRLAECKLADAETMAALAHVLGTAVPHRALDKAWRQLVFGAHHDGITGSESDQVYLDLLAGWREALELAEKVEEHCRQQLIAAVDTSGEDTAVVVTNTTGEDRSDLVCMEVPASPAGHALEVIGSAGQALPVLVEDADRPETVRLRFVATDVPGIGYRSFGLRRPAVVPRSRGWAAASGAEIVNEYLEIASEPARGGGLVRITERASGFELVPTGEVANELVVYPEYPDHPVFGEGPWHLLPFGEPARSRSGQAVVRRETSSLGERLVVEGRMVLGEGGAVEDGFDYRQIVTLWHGIRRAELRTEIHGWAAKDRLLRLRIPTVLAGATPVSAVGDAVVARGFALLGADSSDAPWTLDNPAAEWFGLSATLVVEASDAGPAYHRRAIGVAEIVTPPGKGAEPWARELVVALVQKGVTATCSEAQRNRYGGLHGDSNLPDFRIAIGGPTENAFVAEVLQDAGLPYRAELDKQLASQGWARVLVPPTLPLAERWQPNADLRDARALPVLVVAASDETQTRAAASALATEIVTGRINVAQPASLVPRPEDVHGWTVAVINRGTPGFAVDSSGALYASLLRACTGWPSGVWIDPPRRSTPDGSAFELQHWSHVFDHALVVGQGDWRDAGCVQEAQAYNRPLTGTLANPHPGVLPRSARLLGVRQAEGPGRAVVGAVKPAGNHLASSGHGPADTEPGEGTELTVRLYEAEGQGTDVTLESRFGMTGARLVNLLEEGPGEDLAFVKGDPPARSVAVPLQPGQLATVRLSVPRFPGVNVDALASPEALETEPAQPVFSRYWLHNKGAAPMGNQALAVHALATSLVVRPGDGGEFIAQVASGAAQGTYSGHLEIIGPDGWEVDPPSRLFSLAAGAFLRVPVHFRTPQDCRPGRRFLSVRASDGSGQVQEDVVTVDVLGALEEAGELNGNRGAGNSRLMFLPAPFGHPASQVGAELEADLETDEIVIAPGATATIALRLTNCTAGELRAEVQLLSPVETWPLTGSWVKGVHLAPREQSRVEVAVRGPNQGGLVSWALFKVTYFGRIWYSPAVSLRLGDNRRETSSVVSEHRG
jgi:alpha-mannosidase